MQSVWKVVAAVVFPMLAAAGWARGADYYVSPWGKDSNPGTAVKPWQSLSRVNSEALRAGDQVLLQGGQRFKGKLVLEEGSNASPRQPLTIGSFGEGRAVIEAGLETGILVRNIGGVVIRDLVVVGRDASQNQGYGIKVVNERGTARLDFVRIENVDVSGFHWSGIYVGGPPILLPEFSPLPGSRFGFRDVQISRAAVHNNMYCGILVSGPWKNGPDGYANEDVTIRNCVVHDNRGDPAFIKHHTGDGILVDDTDRGTIDHCTAYRNGGENGSRGGGPVGIWADSANRITIQFCQSYENHTAGVTDGGGFDLDGGVSNSLVQYNFSHDNDGVGFLIWNYKYVPHSMANNVIRYNVSENDGRKHYCGPGEVLTPSGKVRRLGLYNCASIEIGSQGDPIHHVEVYNNTVLAKKNGDREPNAIWVGGSADNSFLNFRNNLLMSDGGMPLVEVEKRQTGVKFQGNAYWTQGKGFLVLFAGTEYHDLAAWRAQTGQETLNGKNLGMFVDPRMGEIGVEATLADVKRPASLAKYHLLPGSPLIDAALDLYAEFGIDVGSRDLWGTPIPQGRGFDIGASEAQVMDASERRGLR